MKKVFMLLCLCVVVVSCSKKEESADVPLTGTSEVWHSFNEGMALAIEEKRPFFVDIYTDWCHWCKVMDEKTFSDEKVIKYFDKAIVPIKLDAESETERIEYKGKQYSAEEFTAALGVKGFPAIAFFDQQGELLQVMSGYQSPENFISLLEFVVGKEYLTESS